MAFGNGRSEQLLLLPRTHHLHSRFVRADVVYFYIFVQRQRSSVQFMRLLQNFKWFRLLHLIRMCYLLLMVSLRVSRWQIRHLHMDNTMDTIYYAPGKASPPLLSPLPNTEQWRRSHLMHLSFANVIWPSKQRNFHVSTPLFPLCVCRKLYHRTQTHTTTTNSLDGVSIPHFPYSGSCVPQFVCVCVCVADSICKLFTSSMVLVVVDRTTNIKS